MQLILSDDYRKQLLTLIPQAKKRVVLAAMVVLTGEKTDPIIEELRNAAKRGVQVRVLLDSYFSRFEGLTRGAAAPTPGKRLKRVRKTIEALKELSAAGVRVYYFGKLGLVPFRGRCHVKATVIDNHIFSFGGVNFSDESYGFSDYMLHTESKTYADYLEDLIKRIGTLDPPLDNDSHEIDSQHTILFDGGRRHNSLIYEKACELTAQADRVYFVSRMVPSSKLAHLLHETDSTLYYNRPNQLMAPDSWGQAFDEQKYRLTNSHTGNHFIHAKFMLFELPGGRKALLTGSNNFSYRGVAFGTQEIALYATDETLWDQLYTYLKRHIAGKGRASNSSHR